MNKTRKFSCILSVLLIIALLFCGLFFPMQTKSVDTVQAEDSEATSPWYAYVLSDNKVVGNQINVQFGVALDIGGSAPDENNVSAPNGLIDPHEIDTLKTDFEYKRLKGKAPYFSSVKIWVRTRDASAVAGMGDYDPIDTVYTFGLYEVPNATLSINVNGSEFGIEGQNREFYFEIYKVELTDAKFSIDPTKTPDVSTKTLSISSKRTLQTESNDDGLSVFTDITPYSQTVEKTTISGSKRITLNHTLSGEWYENVKYMAQNGMVKLAIETDVEAKQTSYGSIWVEDGYAVVEQFIGNTNIAKWYIKYESDATEYWGIEDAYNGTFDGATVKTEILDGVKINGNYLIIDDFNAIVGDENTFTTQFSLYKGEEEKTIKTSAINYIPVNNYAKVVGASVGRLRIDEDGNKKIGLSLRFSEPLQIKENAEKPRLKGFLNNTETFFEYVTGAGTDTFYFETDVTDTALNIQNIRLDSSVINFGGVYDYAPNVDGQQPLSPVINHTLYGWDENNLSEKLPCSFDLRTPSVTIDGTPPNTVKTSHNVYVETFNVSETGFLHYAWVDYDPTADGAEKPTSFSTTGVLAQGFQQISSPVGISGKRWLCVKAKSELGAESALQYSGPYYFDNDKPVIENFSCTSDMYNEKTFQFDIANNSQNLEKYSKLRKADIVVASDLERQNVIATIPSTIGEDLGSANFNDVTCTVTASEIGLIVGSDKEYGNFYLFLEVIDELGNTSDTIIMGCYFDVRDIFAVEFNGNGGEIIELDDNNHTIDLTKSKTAIFTASSVTTMYIKAFERVDDGADASAYSLKYVEGTTNEIEITFEDSFVPGLYQLTFWDNPTQSERESLPQYLYVTNGKAETTMVYNTINSGSVLTNRVFQLASEMPYYYKTSIGATQTEYYAGTKNVASFSSITEAKNYVYYYELLDLYAVKLTETMADSLNDGISPNYRKASSETTVAEAGQVWIRYKEKNWRPSTTTNAWVYYCYDKNATDTVIDVDALPTHLVQAIDNVCDTICSYGKYVDLVAQGKLDGYGAPMLDGTQIHAEEEYSWQSKSGTIFVNSACYDGDEGIYASHVSIPNGNETKRLPLATNIVIQGGANHYLYFKGDNFGYTLIENAAGKTLGQYINATGEYQILEIDENGAREFSVYIDLIAPTLRVEITQNGVPTEKDFVAEQDGETFFGTGFYISEIRGEFDTLAFVSVYKYSNNSIGDFIKTYRKSDFDGGNGVQFDDGKYYIHVSDRSGNDYGFVIQINSQPLECSIKEVENNYIQIECNRNESEVRYEVYFNGALLTTDYNENERRFTESGTYKIVITDEYGHEFNQEFVFERDIPTVDWRYKAASGLYVAYDPSTTIEMQITKVDDTQYSIATSALLQFMPMSGCTYEILSGSPNFNENLTTGWVSLRELTFFKIKIYYEKHPDTYVIYTCNIDSAAPNISVTYSESNYIFSEIVAINGLQDIGAQPTIYNPSFIGFIKDNDDNGRTVYVDNGGIVRNDEFSVRVSDESGVKSVEIYLNGQLVSNVTSNFNDIMLNAFGEYEIRAIDKFGNVTSFSFTNQEYDRFHYFVDGNEMDVSQSCLENFDGETYTKVEYGNSQAEICLVVDGELYYMITLNEEKHYFAFVVENGVVYPMEYYVFKNAQGKIELDKRRGNAVFSLADTQFVDGAAYPIAEIADYGIAIHAIKSNNQLSFVVKSNTEADTFYTVEARIYTGEDIAPYYVKTEICNRLSYIGFVDVSNQEITDNSLQTSTVKLNQPFKVSSQLEDDIVQIKVSHSITGSFQTYETIFVNDTYYDVVFDEEGMYHVVVLNKYGKLNEYTVVYSSSFLVSTVVNRADGTRVEYSPGYTMDANNTTFYSNKNVVFIVYADNVSVFINNVERNFSVTDKGFIEVDIDTVGTSSVCVKDEYGNLFEKTVEIAVQAIDGENLLTGFNEDALRRDENYTNQKISIDVDKLRSSGIKYVSVSYGGNDYILYDAIGEDQVDFVEGALVECIGSLGDGEYTLHFRDVYGNVLEKTVQYRGTPTLSITRTTVNGLTAESYPLDNIQVEGVWTNKSVTFAVSSPEYKLTVDGLENVMTIVYDTKTKTEYAVSYVDAYGFKYNFTVYLHRQDVTITPSASTAVLTIADTFVTKDEVGVEFSENAVCTYTLNGGDEKTYTKGEKLYFDGIYRFTVEDIAGNSATYVIKKDSVVEYAFRVNDLGEALLNGGVVNSGNVDFSPLNSDSAYIKKVFHNNELVEHDNNRFQDRGKWEVIIADEVGNEAYFRFYILVGKINGFSYTAPYDYVISSVIWELDGTSVLATEAIKDGGKRLEASENGFYSVKMKSTVTGDEQSFTFTIDKTPPKVQLVGCNENEKTINDVTISGCQVGDTIYVYKDGTLVKTVFVESTLIDIPTISEGGKYRIVVENEAGVTSELTFERKYIPNTAGSILIIVLCVGMATALLVGLIWRNHSKTDE